MAMSVAVKDLWWFVQICEQVDRVGICEGSLVGGNDQPSPEGGASPPPLGGYRHALPLPPRGRGRRPKAGRGRGAGLFVYRFFSDFNPRTREGCDIHISM